MVWTLVKPFSNKRMGTFVGTFAPFFAMYVMLQPYFAATHKSLLSKSSIPSLEPVVLPSFWTDSALDISIPDASVFLRGNVFTDYKIFNPAVHLSAGQSVGMFAARRDYVTSSWNSWFNTPYMVNNWDTQIIVGKFNSLKKAQSAYVVDINNFKPCMLPPNCNTNGTVVVKTNKGPEDPRVIYYQGVYYLTLFSYDNIVTQSANDPKLDPGYLGDYGTQTDVCVPSEDGLVGRMYLAQLADVSPNKCVIMSIKPIYQSSFVFEQNSIVKNWLAFSYYDQSLYFVHQIAPEFTVMVVDDIAADHVDTSMAYSTPTPHRILDLETYSNKTGLLNSNALSIKSNIHGSVNPVWISPEQTSFKNLATGYHLSILHVLSEDSATNYAAYAFAFCPEPPFSLIAMSERLKLMTNSSACKGIHKKSQLSDNIYKIVIVFIFRACESFRICIWPYHRGLQQKPR